MTLAVTQPTAVVRRRAQPARRYSNDSAPSAFAVGAGLTVLLVIGVVGTLVAGPIVAFGLACAVLAVAAVMSLPISSVLLGLLFLVLAIDNPLTRPADNQWKSPWSVLGKLLFQNFKPMKFNAIDVVMLVLTVRVLFSAWTSHRVANRTGQMGTVSKLFAKSTGFAFAAVLLLEVYGILTGGDFNNSLWQIRALLWTPCIALVVAGSFDRRDRHRFRTVVLVAAVIKAFEGLFVHFLIAKPRNLDLAYVTTHGDSPLFALAVALLVILWFERRSRASFRWMVAGTALFFAAMTFNNRRIAWVALAGCLAFAFSVAQLPVKRSFAKLLGLTWPLLLVYSLVGLKSSSPVFKPVKMVQSVVLQDDRSSDTRDVENFNLSFTFRGNPLIGSGFGHEYVELVHADDISKIFPQYRFLPHNSLLGLWAFGGMLGAGAFWLPLVVGITYAARTLKQDKRREVRIDAVVAVCAVIVYMVQAWGDIGLQDWVGVLLGAVGCGIAGGLARPVPQDAQPVARAWARTSATEVGEL
jgi:hypothetical protein